MNSQGTVLWVEWEVLHMSYYTDSFDDRCYNVKMPWTVEQQLEAYAEHPKATERHEILWDSWKQLKRWMSQMLGYTLVSFPAYSLHNETHCQAILHNIECLLGEAEIRKLSPTDCFVILVTVYLHDIGMIITYTERQNIIKSDKFREMVEELKNSSDPSFRRAAEELQSICYDIRYSEAHDTAVRAQIEGL